MRRSEKIQRFLESRHQVSERDLEKKFGLSFREAKTVLARFYGVPIETPSDSWFRRMYASDIKVIFFLFGVALTVRLVYLWFLSRHDVLLLPLLDAEYYLDWAKNIVTNGWLGDRVFFTEPLYAYIVACVLKVFGMTVGPFVVLCLQSLLGAVFPVILFFLGRKLFSRSVGIVAGLIASLYGPFVFYDGLLLKTSFEVYTIPLFLLAFFSTLEHPHFRSFFLSGLLLGGIVLIKGNALIFVPLAALMTFLFLSSWPRRTRVLFSGLFIAGVLTFMLPVTLRNYVVGHDIVPTNYSIGLALYQGNWWNGDGSTAFVPSFLRPHPQFEESDAVGMAETYVGHELTPSAVSRFWIGQAATEVLASPGHFFATLWHKLLLLFNYREYSDNYSYAFYRSVIPLLWLLPSYVWIVVGGVAGLFLLFTKHFEDMMVRGTGVSEKSARMRFRQIRLMLVLFFVAYGGMLLLTTINARYRMPLAPWLMLFTASLIVFFIDRYQERSRRGLILLALVSGLTLVIAVLPLSLFRHLSFADAYHNIGYWYLQKGEYGLAKEYFEKTIAEDSEYAWGYRNLARIALAEGRLSDGESLLKKVILIRPDDLGNYEELHFLKRIKTLPIEEAKVEAQKRLRETETVRYDADLYEAQRLLASGDEAGAENLMLRSLSKDEHSVATLLALAALKSKHEELPLAKQYLRSALVENPYLLPARYNLANIFIKENNYQEIAHLLKEVYEFTPELGRTWYNYIVALIKVGNTAEATKIMQAYIDRYKDDPAHAEDVKKFQDALKPSTPSIDQMVKNGIQK